MKKTIIHESDMLLNDLIGVAVAAVAAVTLCYYTPTTDPSNSPAPVSTTRHQQRLTGLDKAVGYCNDFHRGVEKKVGDYQAGTVTCTDGTTLRFDKYQGNVRVYMKREDNTIPGK